MHGDRLFILGMHAKILQRSGATLSAFALFGKYRDGPVETDGQNLTWFGQRSIDRPVFDVGAVAPQTCLDHHAIFGMGADVAGQSQQGERQRQVDFVEGVALGNRRALGLGGCFAFTFRLAKLHIQTIGALAQGDVFLAFGVET